MSEKLTTEEAGQTTGQDGNERDVDTMTRDELREIYADVLFDKETSAEIICKALLHNTNTPGTPRPRIANRAADALLLEIILAHKENGGTNE